MPIRTKDQPGEDGERRGGSAGGLLFDRLRAGWAKGRDSAVGAEGHLRRPKDLASELASELGRAVSALASPSRPGVRSRSRSTMRVFETLPLSPSTTSNP